MDERQRMLNDGDFQELTRRKDRISFILTALTMLVYYGFIFLIAFGRDLLAYKITSSIPIGIPLGVGVILASWLFTGIYVKWANDKYDVMVERVREKGGVRHA
ncbi:MAG: DUF485 domain-containing protein [Acidobacteriota bacterium]